MSAAGVKNLGELLVRDNLINVQQLEKAKQEQKLSGGKLGSVLVKLGYIKENQLAEFLSQQYQIPSVDLTGFEIDAKVIQLLNRDFCEKNLLIPISLSGNVLVVAMADPTNLGVRDDIVFVSRVRSVEAVVASEGQIRQAIDRFYKSNTNYESIMNKMERENAQNLNPSGPSSAEIVDSAENQEAAPVVQFVNLMLTEAMKMKASDIHIEPYEKRFRIRYRVDGNLIEKTQPPPGMANAIISRVKIMSKMDISERRRPQDGRIKIRTKGGEEIDFRVSCLPTLFGEKLVLRLLDKKNLQLDLLKLGFEKDDLEKFRHSIHQPYGMILITGPTGSGKTTTIYSALAELNQPDVNISTAEDPVEYNLEGINQVQMNPDVDLTFASALRSFLRQDPDVIMVGEIRDFETAEIAFKAALTGHLVVSTLHTNDAPSSVFRLINMGIEPFLVTSGVNCIVAQRLIRKICENCKASHAFDPVAFKALGMSDADLIGFEYFKGDGCQNCNETGYKGRVSIYEVLVLNEAIKLAILAGATPLDLKKVALQNGMRTLRKSAIIKLKAGLTTIEEVLDSSSEDSQ